MTGAKEFGKYGLAVPLVAASSSFAGCIAIAVLIGWQFRIPFLKAPISTTAFMTPNAALCFILLAISLWLQREKSSGARSSFLGKACAAFVLVFAGLTLLEYTNGLNFSIERLFFAHRLSDWDLNSHPGRFAWTTGLALVSLALALLLLDRKCRRYPLSELLSLFAGLIAFLGLIGYWYGVPYLYDITSGQMAIYTVVTFLLLSTGVFFARSEGGLAALLLSRDISGVVARRLLMMIIVVLPLLGWLELRAEAAGIVSGKLGMVLLICMSVAMFSVLTLDTAIRLRHENLEREFVESLRLLAAIVESTDDAIISESLDGVATTWNQGAERLFGYTAAEAIGQNFTLTVPPEWQQELRDLLQCIRRGERVARHETVRVCKDGRSIDVSVTLSPLKDSHGEINGASAIVRDITGRKRAEAAQRASEKVALEWKQRMELAEQAALPIGFWERDMSSGKVLCSDEIYRQIGSTPGDPMGAEFVERLHPQDLPRVETAVESVASGLRRTYEVQFRIIRPDGTICWIDSRGAMASDGSPRLIGIAIDITKLHRTQANYRSMVETAPYGIFRSTVEGRFLMVNPALVQMLGYAGESELLSLNLEHDVYRDPGERARLVSQFMETGSLKEIETEFKRKDGSVITVRISAVPLRKESGEIEVIQGFIQDVTERKTLARQFWQAQKMEAIGRLAGGVAHDFNNVLMIVGSYAELIMQSRVADETVARYADLIHETATKAVSVTRQLLAFSRQQIMELEVLDLNTVVAELGKILPKLLGEDVVVVTTLEPTPHWVKVDRGQMEQIVMNLAANARDAMPKGGRFEIKTQDIELGDQHPSGKPGFYVRLSVSDTGTGMDADTQSRIFEPFFTTKERGKGTGLGLATVYGIVKQSGGFISLTSEVGRGTTFAIHLPLLPAPVAAVPKPVVSKAASRGSETILLVEDEDSLRAAICEFLRSEGYTVVVAANGVEARRTCEQHTAAIDLILTDLIMPGMGGIEVAEAISSQFPDIRILYMTGYAERAAELLGAGAVLLRKPFRLSELASKLRAILDEPIPAVLVP